jgi:hypothetical protein
VIVIASGHNQGDIRLRTIHQDYRLQELCPEVRNRPTCRGAAHLRDIVDEMIVYDKVLSESISRPTVVA